MPRERMPSAASIMREADRQHGEALAEIEKLIDAYVATGRTITSIGMAVARDSCLITDMRRGRRLSLQRYLQLKLFLQQETAKRAR